MPSRVWTYQKMANYAPLTALVGDRIFQATRVTAAPREKPYIMYRFLADTRELWGDDQNLKKGQSFQVMAHDHPGDYKKIDQILGVIHDLFHNATDADNGIVRCTWVDDSEDLRDDVMGTILRYSRFRTIYG